MVRGVFVAATKQHVGKSTTSLGLIASLIRRVPLNRVGYMKPVGQRHQEVEGRRVDKDCRLTKDFFGLQCDYADMSPVLIPSGYTRRFLDGHVDQHQQEEAVLNAWDNMRRSFDNIIVEGTGHMGVGAIVGLDNARVAKLLGLEVVLVCEGGLGSAFDELSLNLAVCRERGVTVRAVVLNKCRVDKLEMLREYFTKALLPHGIPLAGLVPREPFLSSPSMNDYAKAFKAPLLTGQLNQFRHCRGAVMVGASSGRFAERLARGDFEEQLLVVHESRTDILEKLCLQLLLEETAEGSTIECPPVGRPSRFAGGILLTGHGNEKNRMPSKFLEAACERLVIPCIHTGVQTVEAVNLVQTMTAKLTAEDKARTDAAITHLQEHIDFDRIWH